MTKNLLDDVFGRPPRKPRKKKAKNLEKKLSYQIALYLRMQYPDVEFRFDIAADLKLTMGQAIIVKDKLLHKRGYHDLTILEPRGGFFGLFIELKKDKSEVFRLDGKLKKKWVKATQSDHNEEQMEHLKKMISKGYRATYGFGFENTKALIDIYMQLEPTKIVNNQN